MRFKNNTKYILSIGKRQSLRPYAVSREFTEKEATENDELQARLLAKHISVYEGPVEAVQRPAPVDVRYEVDPSTPVSGKTVTHEVGKGRPPVQYVVADSEGADGISIDPGGDRQVVTSFDKDVKKAADFIEEGVDASKFKNGADAMEHALNKEFEESTYDDEDNLAENESERGPVLDADQAIDEDTTHFIKSNGKHGAKVTTARDMIEKEVATETAKLSQEMSKSLDQGEAVQGGTPKVTEFLKQPLNAKKFMIAKETDPAFLKEIDTLSQSETVKQLVNQRLNELK